MARKPKALRSADALPTYASWKATAAVALGRQGIRPGVMREKEWRELFIRGKTPEDAARQAEMSYWNTARRSSGWASDELFL
jgi:hypothetical protein